MPRGTELNKVHVEIRRMPWLKLTSTATVTLLLELHLFPSFHLHLMDPRKAGRFEPYKQALRALSARTGAPLPALFTSFIILHEASAVLPLFGLFYVSRSLGVGETVVSSLTPKDESSHDNWAQEKGRAWVQQGESWAQRVGIRYGVFGFEKGMSLEAAQSHLKANIAGDIANAVAAYAATKVSSCFLLQESQHIANGT